MVPSPIDPYGIAKFSIEQDIISANNQFELIHSNIRSGKNIPAVLILNDKTYGRIPNSHSHRSHNKHNKF